MSWSARKTWTEWWTSWAEEAGSKGHPAWQSFAGTRTPALCTIRSGTAISTCMTGFPGWRPHPAVPSTRSGATGNTWSWRPGRVPVPSIPAAAIFQALHSLRAMDEPRHQREYSELLQRVDVTMHQDIGGSQRGAAGDGGAEAAPGRPGHRRSAGPAGILSARSGATVLPYRAPARPIWSRSSKALGGLNRWCWPARSFPHGKHCGSATFIWTTPLAGLLRAHVARWRRGLAGLPAAARKIRASRRR